MKRSVVVVTCTLGVLVLLMVAFTIFLRTVPV